MVRLGRDYTNCLVFDHLGSAEQRAVEKGRLDSVSMNAIALVKAKQDVERQIEVTRELGMGHVELDADPPNPYLDFDIALRKKIREEAESHDVTLSLHLPHTYVEGGVCCPQESDRKIAVELNKRCIEFAADIGAKYVNMRPGTAPFHPIDRHLIHDSLLRSLLELVKFASERGPAFHLENNTASDEIYSEVDDCLAIVNEVREQDLNIYFNLDIGHWFTRVDFGKPIPEPPEGVIEPLPPDLLKELHLNDYVPDERMVRPPIHLGWGLLHRSNLERYAKLVKRKGVEVVVLETALQSLEQVLDRDEILRAESEYVLDIFG